MSSATTGPQPQRPDSHENTPTHHPAESIACPAETASRDAAMAPALVTPDKFENNEQFSPFLKLSPELRNAIYEYAFICEERSGLAPHALTRVNRQVRSESLGIYYPLVHTIDTPLVTRHHFDNFRQWLLRGGLKLFPVPPNFEFTYVCPAGWIGETPSPHLANVRYDREIISPAQEVKMRETPGHGVLYCLGLSEMLKPSTSGRATLPMQFRDAVSSQHNWITRHMSSATNSPAQLWQYFESLVLRRYGKEWDANDLLGIADQLYKPYDSICNMLRHEMDRKRRRGQLPLRVITPDPTRSFLKVESDGSESGRSESEHSESEHSDSEQSSAALSLGEASEDDLSDVEHSESEFPESEHSDLELSELEPASESE